MEILLTGQYPRSEALIEASRRFDRGLISSAELKNHQDKDRLDFEELQKGFHICSSGLFNWADLMRPFQEILPGARCGPLKRFYETNLFWRLLELQESSRIDESKIEEWIKTYFPSSSANSQARRLYNLPFLYLFKEYSQGCNMENIALILEQIVRGLFVNKKSVVCFYEPAFGARELTEQEKTLGRLLIENLKKEGKSIYLWSNFYPLKNRKFYFSLPVDGLGVDFYANSVEEILPDFPKNQTLLAGVLNTESTALEDLSFLNQLKENISAQNIFLTPNGPSELIPRQVMDQKVKQLKEAVYAEKFNP